MFYDRIVEIVCQQLGLEPDLISENTSFLEDLGADSLDVVELTMTMEEKFGIPEVSEEDLKKIVTIGDLVSYVEKYAG